nr:Gag-Pol polyprotein [Tanacetum cinerariifolium]
MQILTSNTLLHNAIMEAGSNDRPPMLAPDKKVPISKGSPVTRTKLYMETYKTVSQDIRDQLNAKAEAVQIILTGIDNDIYSTVDACPNACEMWKAIERLKQGESINVQDLENNLYWEFGKFTSQDGESLESYYSRFYKMMNELIRNQCESQELKTVSYHKLYDILKQHQNEVNELRVKRIARTANPLALVAQQQPVYHPQTHLTHYTQNSSTRSQQAATRNRGKAIVNSPLPIYNQEPSMVTEDDETANQDNSPRINKSTGYKNQRIGNVAEAKETVDAADSGPIFDAEPLQKNGDNNDLDNERELLASLIEKLKCKIDESKNRNKFLEKSNKVLIEKLKGKIQDFKNKNKSLESSNKSFKEANNKLSETSNLLYTDFKKSQAKPARHNDVEYASKVEIDSAKARGDLKSYKMESQKSFNKYTQTINDLNQTILEMKNKLCAHQETISILLQQKEAQIKLYKTHEDKELDKVIALENKVKVLDNIVYKTDQSVQTMNMLNNKCRTSFAKPEFLKKAQRVNPRLYDIGCYNDNLALMLALESDEVIRLKKESQSKLSDLIRPYDYEKLNNLYDLFVPQREKSSEQRYFSERSRLSHTSVNNGNSKESFIKQTTLLAKRMDESIP